jgi:hypothetical protein
MRVHRTTRQQPAVVFAERELPLLLAAPSEPCRVPAWSEAKVQRDFHVRAQNAFYSVPYGLIGQQVTARTSSLNGKLRTSMTYRTKVCAKTPLPYSLDLAPREASRVMLSLSSGPRASVW